MNSLRLFLAAALVLWAGASRAQQTFNTAFTYQGNLQDHGSPASGLYSMVFSLFGTNAGGAPIAGPVTNTGVSVSSGLFNVAIDFGAQVFSGKTNWLEISVATNGVNTFTTLTPRQLVTPAPQSIFALNAGTAAVSVSATNFSGTMAGDVSGTQGATVIASVGGQPATNVAQAVVAVNAATSDNTPGTLMVRDDSGSFSAGSISLSGILNLPAPAILSAGGTNFLIEQGSLYMGYHNSVAFEQAPLQNTGFGDYALDWLASHTNTGGSFNTGIGEFCLFTNSGGQFNTGAGAYALYQNRLGSQNTALGAEALYHNTASDNTAVGSFSLFSNTIGVNNTAGGWEALYSNTNGSDNTANGLAALYSNTRGSLNTAVGEHALYSNTTGSNNTAVGYGALQKNVGAVNLTAMGFEALYSASASSFQTAVGYQALYSNIVGSSQTAVGYQALYSDTNGFEDTATGFKALYSNASVGNTADGANALFSNTTGRCNTGTGGKTLFDNTTGNNNTSDGYEAMGGNQTGGDNTGVGAYSLHDNQTGNANTAIGSWALGGGMSISNNTASGYYSVSTLGSFNTGSGAWALGSSGIPAISNNAVGFFNTADGAYALYNNTSGSNNVAVGYQAGLNLLTGNNNIYIGNQGTGENFTPAEENSIRIGSIDNTSTSNIIANTYIAGIWDNQNYTNTPMPVYVDSMGHLGVLPSSAQFKQNIQSMGDASDVLLALRPVTFQYRSGIDPKGAQQFGLVAEEVERVDPDLVVHDQRHGIYSVRYEAVNAMLLNEFLKEHRNAQQQRSELDALKQKTAILEAQSADIARLREKASKVDALEQRLKDLEEQLQSLASQR